MVQDKFEIGMYVIDKSFRIVNINATMSALYPSVTIGQKCYHAIALQEKQCEICPLKADNALFYNAVRKEWIHANAAVMDYPSHGECYSIQFQSRKNRFHADNEILQGEDLAEHIRELSGGETDVCVIGGYCALGSPLAYANQQMINLLGYDSLEDLAQGMDGLVSNTIHPEDLDRVTVDLTNCAMNGGTFETTYRIHHKNNTWFPIVARGKRTQSASGEHILLCVITDMAEFVKRQTALQEQNQNLLRKEFASQAMLEHMPGGYHQCADAEGWPFLHISKSFEEITGWTREEIEQDFGNLFINMVLPEDLPLCAGIIEDIHHTKGYSNAIYRLKRKGGGHIWISDATMVVDLGEESFYHGTIADVTEQIEGLEQARLEAEASNLAKSSFLFNASHDIRTPMNAIQGFAHIIKENAKDPVILETVQKLIHAGEVLLTLMNDVLELSRIEQGKETVNIRPLDMNTHTEKLHEMMAVEMEKSGILFRMENQIQHPLVLADDLKLTRIAMNFLSNARKFTPAGGTVTFGVVESDYDGRQAVYHLFVKDTGIGMSEEFQKHAFEQFERERSSTASGVTGSGLGLAITKKIADLVNGTCTIESKLGAGTTISCAVPLMLTHPSSFQPEAVQEVADFTGKRVLLVEDNDFNREIARYVFEGIGLQVEEAVNGVACIEKLTAAPGGFFDFVLMDVQMPVMDGYTATEEIRRYHDRQIAGIPIIAMTANAFDEDRRKCMEVGMDGHISKPMDAKAVLAELTRVLNR